MLGVWAIAAFHVPAFYTGTRGFGRAHVSGKHLQSIGFDLNLKQAPWRQYASMNRLLFILYEFPEKNGNVDLEQ
ncbi:hypothetical protein [Paucimonas lemoignei]|uniref:hypothetical protein n=1 Tax=Paucimonas lemoignei TaxID=29443 RepID=UPI001053C809|nr:hypothetical protein [Paucimonas lemoignei]